MKVPSTPDADYLPELLHNVTIGNEKEMRILHQFLQQQTAAVGSVQNTSLLPVKPERHHRHSLPTNTTTIITTPATPPAAMVNAPVEIATNTSKSLAKATTTTKPSVTNASATSITTTTTLTTTSSTTSTVTTDRRLADIHRKLATIATARSTPESSQTDSDDFSPQIARKRKGVCARDILPRFSISIEDETISGGSSSAENTREQSPLALQQQKSMDSHIGVKTHRSRSSIVKSASALGLSLMSSASKCGKVLRVLNDFHSF